MYKQIVVATDGSQNSLRAAKEALKIAQYTPNCNITILCVLDIDKIKKEVLHATSTDSLYLERRNKIHPVEKLCQEANISYSTVFLKGSPGDEIVKFANTNNVDLLVIGSRGLNRLQEMVLGSVSHKVMKRVHCPALIVK